MSRFLDEKFKVVTEAQATEKIALVKREQEKALKEFLEMPTEASNQALSEISLTSMTAIQLTPEELIEFYNKCHGEDGRFCEGGPVSGKATKEAGPVSLKVGKGSVGTGGGPGGSYWHIYEGEKRAGYAYININKGDDPTIGIGKEYPAFSIFLNQASQGKGIGKKAIKQAVESSGHDEIYVHIRRSNIASIKISESAGFKEVPQPKGSQMLMVWHREGKKEKIGKILATVIENLPTEASNLETEFYNKCHGDDGRFCESEGKGNSSREPVSGKFLFGGKKKREREAELERLSTPIPNRDLGEIPFDEESDFRLERSKTHKEDLEHWQQAEKELDIFHAPGEMYMGYDGYILSPGYRVNNHLREPGIDPYSGEHGETVKGMDMLFQERSTTTEGATVYRGVGHRFDKSLLIPGNVIQDEGFMSTALNPRAALYYTAEGQDGALFHIKTKQDTKAIPGNDVTIGYLDQKDLTRPFDDQHEYVLNRGTALKINTVASDIKTRRLLVEAEVV